MLRDRKVYIWHPDLYAGRPFFLPVSDVEIILGERSGPDIASRVQDYTPYFRGRVELRPALAASPLVDDSKCNFNVEDDSDTDEDPFYYINEVEKPSNEETIHPLRIGLYSSHQRKKDVMSARQQFMYNAGWTATSGHRVQDYEWTDKEKEEPC